MAEDTLRPPSLLCNSSLPSWREDDASAHLAVDRMRLIFRDKSDGKHCKFSRLHHDGNVLCITVQRHITIT